ncbi:hypothetical protein AG1IA_09871 [Rhizoctonia solani AG-1 IA]|uniref:Uncharacterized protein n=1 Tax=Thanatephorus cucumeris (strain AG1-IA) TaxID=983506 RepID=L8WIA8_THACA|nr:hypothetical protein AG1IA_09871 [Rhizoctonia solani AG-1 IA]
MIVFEGFGFIVLGCWSEARGTCSTVRALPHEAIAGIRKSGKNMVAARLDYVSNANDRAAKAQFDTTEDPEKLHVRPWVLMAHHVSKNRSCSWLEILEEVEFFVSKGHISRWDRPMTERPEEVE